MTLLTNNFEAGSNGTTITTANSGNPSAPFDLTNIGSGATLTFDSTQAAHGTLSGKAATGATVTNVWVAWTTSVPSWAATMYYRAYVFMSALPGTNFDIVSFVTASAVLCGKIRLTTLGKVSLLDKNQANVGVSTNSYPTGAWFRLEGFMTGSATAGQLQAAIYTGSGGDSTTALETVTSANTINTNQVPSGIHFGHANAGAANITVNIDDVAVSDQGTLIGWADYLSTGTGTQDTGSSLDQGPISTHEEIGVDDAAGFP